MEMHPVTITIGVICTVALAVLVIVGLGCVAQAWGLEFLPEFVKLFKHLRLC
jgi:hypothetical protein